MIKTSLKEYDNKIVLSYDLSFLELKKNIVFHSNTQYNFSIEIKPTLTLSWIRDNSNNYILLHIELYNSAARLSSPTYKERYDEFELGHLDECIQDSFKDTIISHIKLITNGDYIFKDKMLNKWPEINVDEIKERFGYSYISKTLNTSLTFSKLLIELDFEKKWSLYSNFLMMQRDLPKHKVIEKNRKF